MTHEDPNSEVYTYIALQKQDIRGWLVAVDTSLNSLKIVLLQPVRA